VKEDFWKVFGGRREKGTIHDVERAAMDAKRKAKFTEFDQGPPAKRPRTNN
jgi:hypothetical protein